MAKQKKRDRASAEASAAEARLSSAAERDDAAAPAGADSAAALEAQGPSSGRLSLGAYLLLNVIFDAFCLLQLLLVRLVLREQEGLYFFFGLLMVSFFIVSVFDYLYDRHIDPAPEAAE